MGEAEDEAPAIARLGGSQRRSRSAASVLVAAIAFIGLAILKPWAAPGAGTGSVTQAVPPTAVAEAPSQTPGASGTAWPWDPNATSCLGPSGIQLVTLVRWPGYEVRTWQPATGADGLAAAEADPSPVVIRSSHVVGLGLCRIENGSGTASTTAGAIVDVVRLDAGGVPGRRLDLGAPPRITLEQPTPYLGVLYGAPMAPGGGALAVRTDGPPATAPDPAPVSAAWTPGWYAVGAVFDDGGSSPSTSSGASWVAVRVVVAAGEPP